MSSGSLVFPGVDELIFKTIGALTTVLRDSIFQLECDIWKSEPRLLVFVDFFFMGTTGQGLFKRLAKGNSSWQ